MLVALHSLFCRILLRLDEKKLYLWWHSDFLLFPAGALDVRVGEESTCNLLACAGMVVNNANQAIHCASCTDLLNGFRINSNGLQSLVLASISWLVYSVK